MSDYPDEEEEALCFCETCRHRMGYQCMEARCTCCKGTEGQILAGE